MYGKQKENVFQEEDIHSNPNCIIIIIEWKTNSVLCVFWIDQRFVYIRFFVLFSNWNQVGERFQVQSLFGNQLRCLREWSSSSSKCFKSILGQHQKELRVEWRRRRWWLIGLNRCTRSKIECTAAWEGERERAWVIETRAVSIQIGLGHLNIVMIIISSGRGGGCGDGDGGGPCHQLYCHPKVVVVFTQAKVSKLQGSRWFRETVSSWLLANEWMNTWIVSIVPIAYKHYWGDSRTFFGAPISCWTTMMMMGSCIRTMMMMTMGDEKTPLNPLCKSRFS